MHKKYVKTVRLEFQSKTEVWLLTKVLLIPRHSPEGIFSRPDLKIVMASHLGRQKIVMRNHYVQSSPYSLLAENAYYIILRPFASSPPNKMLATNWSQEKNCAAIHPL